MPTIRLVIEMNAASEAQAIAELQAMVQDKANTHVKSLQVVSTEVRI